MLICAGCNQPIVPSDLGSPTYATISNQQLDSDYVITSFDTTRMADNPVYAASFKIPEMTINPLYASSLNTVQQWQTQHASSLNEAANNFLQQYLQRSQSLTCHVTTSDKLSPGQRTAWNLTDESSTDDSPNEILTSNAFILFPCGRSYHEKCLPHQQDCLVHQNANKLGLTVLRFSLNNLYEPAPITQQPRSVAKKRYPQTDCCSGNLQLCFAQRCGCLNLLRGDWDGFRRWWNRQTDMCRALGNCFGSMCGISFSPVVHSAIYQLPDAVVNLEQFNATQPAQNYNALSCWQTVYAYLGCLGWSRRSVWGWCGFSRSACIRWVSAHPIWEVEGRLRFGQLLVDGFIVAMVVIIGPTVLLIPLPMNPNNHHYTAPQNITNSTTNQKTTAITLSTSSLPKSSTLPGTTTTLPMPNTTSTTNTNGTVTTRRSSSTSATSTLTPTSTTTATSAKRTTTTSTRPTTSTTTATSAQPTTSTTTTSTTSTTTITSTQPMTSTTTITTQSPTTPSSCCPIGVCQPWNLYTNCTCSEKDGCGHAGEARVICNSC